VYKGCRKVGRFIMTDHLTKKMRSWNMSRIRSRHTKPEVIVRSLLHRSGYRFKINDSKLPGCPDIVLPKYRTVIFVHGCFWHRHKNCPKTTSPSTNKEYWSKKFRNNVSRDKKVKKELENLKWRVIIIWECEVNNDPIFVLERIVSILEKNSPKNHSVELNRKQILKLAEERSKYLINKGARNHGN
jgi:DNA mismatch endonuclease (patch repair protein)